MGRRRVLGRVEVDKGLPFIFSVTVGAGQSFQLPTISGGTYDAVIDWGDGNSDVLTVWNATERTHTYSLSGTYDISISGIFNGWSVNNYADRLKITEVKQWGILRFKSNKAFYGCNNLTMSATDAPDLTGELDFTQMFRDCHVFNGDIGDWDVSSVNNMTEVFNRCYAFNQDIGGWNVSSVTNMPYMFQFCSAFNQDIGGWNVSSVTNMLYMFYSCSAFNQNIGSWDVSSVVNMQYTFFGCSVFNQNIGGWNVSSVNNTQRMFYNCYAFNQDIGGWNVSSVTNMAYMFYNCYAFNQNIGSWNVTLVASMLLMFSGATLSTANYNALLIGWAAQSVKSGVLFSAGSSKYSAASAASAARAVLTGTYGWAITDGGPA